MYFLCIRPQIKTCLSVCLSFIWLRPRFQASLAQWGVSISPIQFESAPKIWPLLELLAKIRWVLACSCSQNFCKCSHARIFVKIRWLYAAFWKNAFSFCWRLKLTGLSPVLKVSATLLRAQQRLNEERFQLAENLRSALCSPFVIS